MAWFPTRLVVAAALVAALSGATGAGAAVDPRALTGNRLSAAARAVRDYRERTGELPTSSDGIEAAVPDRELLTDGWGHPLVYLRIAGGFWLVSWGADGVPGGTGDAADIVEISR